MRQAREYLPLLLGSVWFGLFLSHNLSVAHDSIYYLSAAIRGTDPWHANHPLTVPFMEWVMYVGKALGLPFGPVVLGTLPSMAAGACTMQIVFLLFRRRLGMGYFSSLLGALMPAVAFGSWYYSVAIEAYAVPTCLMLLCLYLLADERRDTRTYVVVALIHSVAALFHQYVILMGPLVLYAIYTTPHWRIARKHRMLFTYTAITFCMVGGAYTLIGIYQGKVNTPGEFFYWLLGNATKESAGPFVGGFHLKSIPYAFVGFGRAFIGAHFLFVLPELDGVLTRLFSLHSLNDERFLVATLAPWFARVLAAATVLWFLWLLVCAVRALRCWPAARRSPPIVMVIMLLVPMTLVFTFYFGRNIDFWIMQSVCVCILLAWALNTLQARRSLVALVLGMLAINLLGTMQFVRTGDRDYNQWRIEGLATEIELGDMLVIGDPWPTASFIDYFVPVESVSLVTRYLGGEQPNRLREKIDSALAEGRRVFFFDDVFDVGAKSARFYGSEYVAYVEVILRDLPPSHLIGQEHGRRHRVIEPPVSDPGR